MELSFALIGLVLGVAIGYIVFYFRYADRKLVDDLRNNLLDLQHQMQSEGMDLKEYEQQNFLLKEKVTELITKNDDLMKISSELYRYYHRIKEGHEKALELVDLLKSFDKDFDEKIKIAWDDRSIPIQSIGNINGEIGVKRF